jgi:beta-mannanase
MSLMIGGVLRTDVMNIRSGTEDKEVHVPSPTFLEAGLGYLKGNRGKHAREASLKPEPTTTPTTTQSATLTLNVKTVYTPQSSASNTPSVQTQPTRKGTPILIRTIKGKKGRSSTTTTPGVTPPSSVSPTPETPTPQPAPTPLPPQTPPTPVPPPQTPPPAPTPVPAPAPSPSLSWGVFAGSAPNAIAEFESRVSHNPDYLAYFVHWANGGGNLPLWLKTYAGDKNRTLVLFWEASDYIIGGTNQPAYAYRTILRGDHDAYIKSFAEQLRTYGKPVILIPFSELNGNWTPWSGTTNGNTPEEAVQAFRYVHGFFNNVPNVKFGLALNAASVPNTPENAHSAYYPGDEYVDYIGLDGFNMNNPWMSFDEIFAPGLQKISQYGKPLFIFSFGSAEGQGKSAWLQDAFSKISTYPNMKGFIYFNQNKERNWLLWSDSNSFNTFESFVRTL